MGFSPTDPNLSLTSWDIRVSAHPYWIFRSPTNFSSKLHYWKSLFYAGPAHVMCDLLAFHSAELGTAPCAAASWPPKPGFHASGRRASSACHWSHLGNNHIHDAVAQISILHQLLSRELHCELLAHGSSTSGHPLMSFHLLPVVPSPDFGL